MRSTLSRCLVRTHAPSSPSPGWSLAAKSTSAAPSRVIPRSSPSRRSHSTAASCTSKPALDFDRQTESVLGDRRTLISVCECRVTAEVKHNTTNAVVCRVQGEWNGVLEFSYTSGETRVVDVTKLPVTQKCVRPVEKQGPTESRSEGWPG